MEAESNELGKALPEYRTISDSLSQRQPEVSIRRERAKIGLYQSPQVGFDLIPEIHPGDL